MEIFGQMTQEKKTGSFTIQYNGRTLPVDVYQLGETIHFKITFGDASETHLYHNNDVWSGRIHDVHQPFIELLEKKYPHFISHLL